MLRIGLTAETLPGPIRIDLAGCLTEDSVKDLMPTLWRGATFQGCPNLVVNLRNVDHLEASALKVVEAFTSGHNATGGAPIMSIQPPQPDAAQDGSATARCGVVVSLHGQEGTTGRSSLTDAASIVADLMTPVGTTVGITDSLGDAAERIIEGQDAITVVGLEETVIGFISSDDLKAAAFADPTGWQKKRCASLVQFCQSRLRPHHTLEGVIHQYREEGVGPLLVFNADAPIGLLHPDAVRQWWRHHGPSTFDDLMYKPALDQPALNLAAPHEVVAA